MKEFCFFAVILAVGMLLGCTMPETIELCGKGNECADPPPEGDWACNDDGTSATLTYCPEWQVFSYNVGGVVPNENANYTLIYYPDPWPGNGLICLSEPTLSGPAGEISLSGKVEINTDLPIPSDDNYADGAKLWLVPSGMVDCEGQVMANWSDCPGILFEKDVLQNRVFYTDTGP
jgi:hypothetical protein